MDVKFTHFFDLIIGSVAMLQLTLITLDASTHQKMFADQPPANFHGILVLKLLGHEFGSGGQNRLEGFISFCMSSSLRWKPFSRARLMPLSSVKTPATVALTIGVFLPLIFLLLLHILLLRSLPERCCVLHVVPEVGTAVVEKVLLFVRVSEGAVIKVGLSSGVAVWVATVGWYSGVAIWVVIVIECGRSVRFCRLGLMKLLMLVWVFLLLLVGMLSTKVWSFGRTRLLDSIPRRVFFSSRQRFK